jgi:methyl-accepting chemotaxis protein
MDQVTQQNAAMVQETTAACHSLTREGDSLELSLASFNLGQGAKAALPQAEVRRAPPQGFSPNTRRPMAALKVTGRGGAVMAKPIERAEADDWEEF